MADQDNHDLAPSVNPDDDRSDRSDSSDLSIAARGSAVTISVDRDFIVPALLSAGIASSMVVFIILSFAHPSEANLLIPLIAAPAGAAVVNLIRCKNCKKK